MLGFDDMAILTLAYLIGKCIHNFLEGLAGNGHEKTKTAGKLITKKIEAG